VQTNTRATTTFIVKHGRDTKNGTKALTDMRDIYENNANNGARRLREQIFAILPKWFTEEAQDRCRATLENGGRSRCRSASPTTSSAFGDLGVGVDQLERKIGREQDRWTAHDVARSPSSGSRSPERRGDASRTSSHDRCPSDTESL
jgi:hypothetical protein